MDPNLLSMMLNGGGSGLPASPTLPMQPPANPLASLGLSIPNQPGDEARTNLDYNETTKELKDRILKESPANAILMGMLEKGETPEKMTGGQIARNALANFARGIMMGSNFRPIEDEQRDKRRQDFQTKLATVKAAVAEDNAQKMQARQLLVQMQGERWKSEVNAIKQQEEQRKLAADAQKAKNAEWKQNFDQKVFDTVTVPKAASESELKKAQANKARLDAQTAQYLVNNPILTAKTPAEIASHMLIDAGITPADPNFSDKWTAAFGSIQEQIKLSKYPPQSGGESLRPLAGFDSPDGTLPVISKTGAVSLVPVPDGVGKMATSTTRTGAERAKSVDWLADEVLRTLDMNEKHLGAPLASRWVDFKAGKVGLPNAGYTELSSYAKLLQTKLMQVHTGNRASDTMLHHFAGILDTAVQDPVNLRTTVNLIKKYAETIQVEAKPSTSSGNTSAVPAVGGTFNGGKVTKVTRLP